MADNLLEIPEARLQIEPDILDFGELTRQSEIKDRGQAVLTITNTGNRVLVGEINIQVGWLDAAPKSFRLNPGESSAHIFSIVQLSPTVWTTHRLGSDFVALITSNGGSASVGGFYFSPIEETRKQAAAHPIKRDTMIVLAALLLLVLGILAGARGFLRYEDHLKVTEQIAKMYTQAVETMDAVETAKAPTATPLFGVSDMEAFNATAAAYGESLIINVGGDSSPTNTPWPSSKYPAPQQFIVTYYSYLSARDFDSAWWMLSENFQRTCCYNGSGTPIENYRELMGDISRFEVPQAYLQAEDVNPAEVRFEVVYYNKDGTMDDHIYTALIIDDAERNTLLIDEIK